MIFVMTVDTEADNQWDHGAPLTTENVRFWAPFQALCERSGILPTYLVTSEIAADQTAQDLLASWVADGKAEVGAHLHPWTTPPFLAASGYTFNDSAHPFLSELPDDLVRGKLETLTHQIQANLGVRPISFRAGRFGFDVRCAQILANLGYEVDSSVTPSTEWSAYSGLPGGRGGPDFTAHDSVPFLIEGMSNRGLLEIPVTIVPTYRLLRRFRPLLSAYRSLPGRALRRSLFRHWLSPQPVWLKPADPAFTQHDFQRAFEYQQTVAEVGVMFVHSSELMPGGSPTRPTALSVQQLLQELEVFFGFVRDRGAVAMTLSQAATELRAWGNLEVRPV